MFRVIPLINSFFLKKETQKNSSMAEENTQPGFEEKKKVKKKPNKKINDYNHEDNTDLNKSDSDNDEINSASNSDNETDDDFYLLETREAQEALIRLDRTLGILDIFTADALGRPFEFSPRQNLRDLLDTLMPDLHMLDAGSYSGNNVWPMIKAGQWTDDAAQAACWIMTLIYVDHFINKKRKKGIDLEDGSPKHKQQLKNLYTNMFNRLVYQWYKHSLNSGLTPAQQAEEMRKQGLPSIGCGDIVRKNMDYWEEIEKKHNTTTETFLLGFDSSGTSKGSFYQYLIKHEVNMNRLDGNAATMRNITAAFAKSAKQAMLLAGYQTTTTTKGLEAFACAQLQAYLSFKAKDRDINVDPEACKQAIFSQESLDEFLELYQEVNQCLPPDNIIALCKSAPGKKTNRSDTRWLNWRVEMTDYKLDHYDTGDYYGGYATKGLAFIFNIIINTQSNQEALNILAQLAGDADSNCAAAKPILGALYGHSATKKEHKKAVGQYRLNQKPLRKFDRLTQAVIKRSLPVDPQNAEASDLLEAALPIAEPTLYRKITDLAFHSYSRAASIINSNTDSPSIKLENAKAVFRLLHGMDGPDSNQLRQEWLTILTGDEKAILITQEELNDTKLSGEFINKLYNEGAHFYLYENILAETTTAAEIDDTNDGPAIEVNNIKPLAVDYIYTPAERTITLWKNHFNGTLDEEFKPSKDEFLALVSYLKTLEYDTSPEAEAFKCQAFSFLLEKAPPQQPFDLAKVLGYEQVITGQQEYSIIHNKMRLNKSRVCRYRGVLNVFEQRINASGTYQIQCEMVIDEHNNPIPKGPNFTPEQLAYIEVACVVHPIEAPPLMLASERREITLDMERGPGTMEIDGEEWTPGVYYINQENGATEYAYACQVARNDIRVYHHEFTHVDPLPHDSEHLDGVLRDKVFADLMHRGLYRGRYAIANPWPTEKLLDQQPGGPILGVDTDKTEVKQYASEEEPLILDLETDNTQQDLNVDNTQQDLTNAATLFPFFGKGGHGTISVARFQDALSELDPGVKLAVAQENADSIVLHVHPSDDKEAAEKFVSKGMIASFDEKCKPYFELTINKNSSKAINLDNLFGIEFTNGKRRRHFNFGLEKQLTEAEKQGIQLYTTSNEVVQAENDQAVVNAMKTINQFLSDKAKEAGYFSYSGNAYHRRRRSWEVILDVMQRETDLVKLKEFIAGEASNFWGQSTVMWPRKDRYAKALIALNTALNGVNNLDALQTHIKAFRQAYTYMDECQKAAQDYQDNFNHLLHERGLLGGLRSFSLFEDTFTKNEALSQKVIEAKNKYNEARQALGQDADDFLTAEEERDTEHNNYIFRR